MATKNAVNKAQAVRDYLNAYPGAAPSEIALALNRQGIRVAVSYVATIKATICKAVAPLQNRADTLTQGQMKMVAQAIRKINSRLGR